MISPIYKKAHWRNTTKVCETSGHIGFGLMLADTDETALYKLTVQDAQNLAESLLEFLTAPKSGVSIPLDRSDDQHLIVDPTPNNQLHTCKHHQQRPGGCGRTHRPHHQPRE